MKHARCVDSKDKNLQLRNELKSKMTKLRFWECWKISLTIIYFSFRRTQVPEISENKDILYYVMNEIWCNRNKVNVDNVFAYNTMLNVINDNDNEYQE